MADTTALLQGLIDYRDTLMKHLSQLNQGFETLSREWQHFSLVYEGDAAHEFKGLWFRTSSNFQEYLDRTQRIVAVLDERINFLQEANRPDSGLT